MLGKSHDLLVGSAGDSAAAQAQWANFVVRNFAEFAFNLRKESNFTIKARSRTCEGFMLARLRTLAGRAQLMRGKKEIKTDSEDRYALYLPLQGKQDLLHFGRDIECKPGAVALVSMSEALTQVKHGDNDTLYFLMPRGFLDSRLIWDAESFTKPILAEQGLWRLISDTIIACHAQSNNMTDAEFLVSAQRIADLIVFALQDAGEPGVAPQSAKHCNLARAKRIMRAKLSDLDLNLATIAQECGISLRYLHQLFQSEGKTAQEYLRDERLRYARRLLETPLDRQATITDVALASGFKNLSHFSTVFRQAFGVSPRDILKRSA